MRMNFGKGKVVDQVVEEMMDDARETVEYLFPEEERIVDVNTIIRERDGEVMDVLVEFVYKPFSAEVVEVVRKAFDNAYLSEYCTPINCHNHLAFKVNPSFCEKKEKSLTKEWEKEEKVRAGMERDKRSFTDPSPVSASTEPPPNIKTFGDLLKEAERQEEAGGFIPLYFK